MVSIGPQAVLQSYKDLDVTEAYDWVDHGGLPFSDAFDAIWLKRKLSEEKVKEKSEKAILDSVNGDKDPCMSYYVPSTSPTRFNLNSLYRCQV